MNALLFFQQLLSVSFNVTLNASSIDEMLPVVVQVLPIGAEVLLTTVEVHPISGEAT